MFSVSRRRFLTASAAGGLALAAPRAFAAEKLKVAGIHASPVENAWNSRLHEALQSAAKDGIIEYVFSEGVSGTDYPRAMREYAEQGHKLIVGESYAVEAQARQLATDYPQTAFLMGSSGKPSGDNFGTFGTWNHEAAYLAGMLAAPLSKSGTFGTVGAIPIPEVNILINAFRSGVKEVRPDAKFLIGFIGTFFDLPRRANPALRRSMPVRTSFLESASVRLTPPRKRRSNRSVRCSITRRATPTRCSPTQCGTSVQFSTRQSLT
jgi:basic membrane lipoprotein Med (substrate-binding protein (PBP1-ABC) superfamily)